MRQVESGGDSAFVAMVDEDKTFLLNLDGLLDDLSFGIEFAQVEVVGGEFRGQDQLHVLQIGGGALQAGVGCLEILTVPAEQIDFVVQRRMESDRRFA